MLGRKAALGGIFLIGARLSTRLIDLLTMIVLARFLLPADFGLVAVAMSLVLVTETASELSLSQALVRLPEISRPQLDTAFTLGLLRGLVLFALLTAIAWPFSRFYDEARLFPLVIVLSVAPIARGLASPAVAGYQKDLSFWRDLATELCGKTVSSAAAVSVAFATQSYWAVAIGTVAYPLFATLSSYVLAPYRPRLSLSAARAFTGFIGWFSAAQIVLACNWQFERLLLAKVTVASQLGLFSLASDIAGVPFQALFTPMLRPLLAAFSLLRHDERRLAASYQTASAAIFAVGLPLLVGEALVAEPVIRLILGAQWLGSVAILQWLALGTVPALLALPAIPLFMSADRTKLFFQRNLLEISVKLPFAVIATWQMGVIGIAVARFCSELAAALFCALSVRRLLHLSLRDQFGGIWRSLLSTLLMAPAVLACLRQVPGGSGPFESVCSLLLAVGSGAAVYGGALTALWHVCGCPAGIEAMVLGAAATRFRQWRKIA